MGQDTIFNDIRRFSEQTAQNTQFTDTDMQLYWFAFISCIIAIVAFAISAFALYYTIRTLKSQERTERNTRLIPEKERHSQLTGLLYKLFRNTSRLIALIYKSGLYNHKKHPAVWHFQDLHIDESLLTVDAFWNDEKISAGIVNFSQAIKNYNRSIDKLQLIVESEMPAKAKLSAYRGALRGTMYFYGNVLDFLNANFQKYLQSKYYNDEYLQNFDISKIGDYRILIENGSLLGEYKSSDYCHLYPVTGKGNMDFHLKLEDIFDSSGKELYIKYFMEHTGKKVRPLTSHDMIVVGLQEDLQEFSDYGDALTFV